jgi:hypothetical protein
MKKNFNDSATLNKYSDISEIIEKIVEECDVGTDRWCRTGVYTFSGDVKSSKRITFGKIQRKLEEHYGRALQLWYSSTIVCTEI